MAEKAYEEDDSSGTPGGMHSLKVSAGLDACTGNGSERANMVLNRANAHILA